MMWAKDNGFTKALKKSTRVGGCNVYSIFAPGSGRPDGKITCLLTHFGQIGNIGIEIRGGIICSVR